MVNKVILVGRLGRDPETRYTASGQQVCHFSVATDENFKDRSGEWQKRTEWHRISMWGPLAERAQKFLKRGSLVYLEGKIRTSQWDDRSGNKRTSTEVVANVMRMLSPKGETAAGGNVSEPSEPMEHPEPGEAMDESAAGPQISDEDIPF